MFGRQNRKRISQFPEDVEVSNPCYQCERFPHPNRHQVAGAEDEVDDVEWSQNNHHEQHEVDGEIPMKIPEHWNN